MYIYYRICTKEETNGFGTRWQQKPKLEILKKCWLSFQDSITEEDHIIFINDHCPQELVDWLILRTKAKVTDSKVPDHDGKPKWSFMHCARVMEPLVHRYQDDIHYIVEDDYLFVPCAMAVLKNLYYKNKWKGFAVLYDYMDRYTIDRTRNCELFLTEHSHWRTVPSATGSVAADGRTWIHHWDIFDQATQFNSDSFTWAAFPRTPCIAPVPGLATHLNEGNMSPLVDWQKFWDDININA